MFEDVQKLDEQAVRLRQLDAMERRRQVEERLSLCDKYRDHEQRVGYRRKLKLIEAEQRALKIRLHELLGAPPPVGTPRAPMGRPLVAEIPDDGFLARLMGQRAVVDAFNAARKEEAAYFGEMLEEAHRRGLLNPDGSIKQAGAIPFGVVPTLEEVGRPLGVTAGFHTGPGPHFPHHDNRRIYSGT